MGGAHGAGADQHLSSSTVHQSAQLPSPACAATSSPTRRATSPGTTAACSTPTRLTLHVAVLLQHRRPHQRQPLPDSLTGGARHPLPLHPAAPRPSSTRQSTPSPWTSRRASLRQPSADVASSSLAMLNAMSQIRLILNNDGRRRRVHCSSSASDSFYALVHDRHGHDSDVRACWPAWPSSSSAGLLIGYDWDTRLPQAHQPASSRCCCQKAEEGTKMKSLFLANMRSRFAPHSPRPTTAVCFPSSHRPLHSVPWSCAAAMRSARP